MTLRKKKEIYVNPIRFLGVRGYFFTLLLIFTIMNVCQENIGILQSESI